MSHGARGRRWSLLFCLAATGILAARPAAANGRYPLAGQVVVDPSNPDHLVARSTFGILRSDDAGASWRWVCEDALGTLQTAEDPALAVTGDGSTIVAFSQGLAISPDGCSWTPAAGVPPGRFAVDVTVSPRRPHAALAIELLVGAATYSVQLVASGDDGATWSEVGAPIPDLLGTTVEVAPSSADRIYVSGKLLTTQQSVLARSDDGGRSFTSFVVAGVSTAAGIFIGAVDPVDADVVYLRVSPAADAAGRVLVSRNGGGSFDELLAVPGDLSGFALSPDGATLAVGSLDSGLYVGSSAGGAFPLVGSIKPSCLTWVGSRLIACAKEAVDSFSIGVSDDGGAHFVPLLRLADVTPGTCSATSSAGICTAQWSVVAATIGADAGTAVVDAGTPGTAGGGGCACGVGPRVALAATPGELEQTIFSLSCGLLLLIAPLGRSRRARCNGDHAQGPLLRSRAQ